MADEPNTTAEERRRSVVSNDVLAERIDSFRTNVDRSFGMLESTVEKEIGALTRGFEKFDARLSIVETFLTRQDERLKVVEEFQHQQKVAEATANKQAQLQLSTAQEGATDYRMVRLISGITVSVLLIIIAGLGLIVSHA